MIHITVRNDSTAISNADIRAMLVGLHHQWNVDPANLGSWVVVAVAFCQVLSLR